MWYCSGTGWLTINEKYEHAYDIKHACCEDGIDWRASGKTSIAQGTVEEAITRPFVMKNGASYEMWFCYRGSRAFRDGSDAYRIGFASSNDLQSWQRRDNALAPSDNGWDSKMVAYPALIHLNDRLLMFYNGNGFGAGGFGVAVSERK
jgi:hypothetical protein